MTVSGAQPDGAGDPRLLLFLTLNHAGTQGAEPGESPALTLTLEKAAHTRTSLILLSYNPTVCGKWFTHQGSFVLQSCAPCAGSQINSKGLAKFCIGWNLIFDSVSVWQKARFWHLHQQLCFPGCCSHSSKQGTGGLCSDWGYLWIMWVVSRAFHEVEFKQMTNENLWDFGSLYN